MKVFVAVCLVFILGVAYGGVLAPTTLLRTPSLDSAVIKSDRLGGNFAYSSVEGHAYTAITPVVQRVVQPVAVSYTAHQIPLGYAAAPIAYPSLIAPSYFGAQHVFANPALSFSPTLISQVPAVAEEAAKPVADSPAPAAVASDEDSVAVDSA